MYIYLEEMVLDGWQPIEEIDEERNTYSSSLRAMRKCPRKIRFLRKGCSYIKINKLEFEFASYLISKSK